MHPPCFYSLNVRLDIQGKHLYFICPLIAHIYAIPSFRFLNKVTVLYTSLSKIRDLSYLKEDIFIVSGSRDIKVIEVTSKFVRTLDIISGVTEPKII